MGGVNPLNKRQVDFINNWEAEAFRVSLDSGASCGKLIDRVAVVTGGGSGIGRSIAIGLARAGATVAIADIDRTAAQETVSLIKKELPKASAEPVFCNVTSEKSVDESFGEVLNKWGGLDIVVNAAGVAPAYQLVDLPVDKWRFALEVNLTGYFLMAKYAAKIMIAQGIGGSIINISSKTGLEASKNNTPYNATKAGELHMARGWAMELGEHNIRVNCVCPGNVFEGSKIWNPEYIKVCAKKYGISPQEVIPYYVNKTMLKKEIKGQDIANAVAFLTSDDAKMITGQTLVVDAGQVMVR
jgi:sorbitol-6-phosphate 2-dehydrogenase